MSNRKEMVFTGPDYSEGKSYWTIRDGVVRYHHQGDRTGFKSMLTHADIHRMCKFKELRPCV